MWRDAVAPPRERGVQRYDGAVGMDGVSGGPGHSAIKRYRQEPPPPQSDAYRRSERCRALTNDATERGAPMLVTPDRSVSRHSDPATQLDQGPATTASVTVPFQPPAERPPKRSGRKCHIIRRFNRILRCTIFGIDWALRRWYGVREFSADQDDLLRIAVRKAERDLTLPDGTRIAAGDMILDLHIWNERVLRLERAGSTLGWASRVRRSIDHSLTNLAFHIKTEPSLKSCRALRATTVFVAGRGAATALGIAGRYGLTALTRGEAAPLGDTLVGFGLAWACNPHSLRGKPLRRVRNELWISRDAFLERYAAAQAAGTESMITDERGNARCQPLRMRAMGPDILVAKPDANHHIRVLKGAKAMNQRIGLRQFQVALRGSMEALSISSSGPDVSPDNEPPYEGRRSHADPTPLAAAGGH